MCNNNNNNNSEDRGKKKKKFSKEGFKKTNSIISTQNTKIYQEVCYRSNSEEKDKICHC